MVDILFLNERVKNAILIGESDFREFKSAWEGRPGEKKPRKLNTICKDIAEGLVAFANTDGGEIIIGVEDDGEITGVPHTEDEIQSMINAVKSHIFDGQVLPVVYSVKITLEQKTILFFQVNKGTHEIFQLGDGRVLIRKDKQTVPANVKRLQFKRQEELSREYDREYVDGALVNDLDIPLVQTFADSLLKGMTVEKYLQQSGLAEYSVGGLRLRRAALLLFAKDIQKWHPRSQVRYLKISGNTLESGEKYNVISDETVQGNIYELLYKSWEALRPFLAYKTIFGTGVFEQQYIYPQEACREALVNAIVHRDYVSHNGVEVHIFDDRMEIKSPGALLSTLTVHDLLALENRHESRNAKIAYILKVNNIMREIGEGVKRIFSFMEEKELDKPKLYSNTTWFIVTLFNRSVYSQGQQEFLKLFDQFKLSLNQKRIVLLGIDEKDVAPSDIFKAMNTKDRDTYNQEITALRKLGIIEEIRTSTRASQISKSKNIDKPNIPRYKILTPLH